MNHGIFFYRICPNIYSSVDLSLISLFTLIFRHLKVTFYYYCVSKKWTLVELCHCLLADGRRQEVHFDKITYRIKKLCYGLNMEFVDPVCKLAQLLSVRLFLDITIFFRFSRWQQSAVLDFKILRLLASWIWGWDASSCQILPKLVSSLWRYCDYLIFLNSSNPPSWMLKISQIYWLTSFRGPRCITVLNFIQISQSVADISQFFKIADAAILCFRNS